MFLFYFLFYILSQKTFIFFTIFKNANCFFVSYFFPKLKKEKITINEFYFCLIYSENKKNFLHISLHLFFLLFISFLSEFFLYQFYYS